MPVDYLPNICWVYTRWAEIDKNNNGNILLLWGGKWTDLTAVVKVWRAFIDSNVNGSFLISVTSTK